MLKRLVCSLMLHSLKSSFRRVGWVGPWPAFPPERPIILASNHHSFFDGYLHWYLLERHLDRKPRLWMEQWDQYPFFSAAGAMPFPADDPRRRAATVRKTVQWFRQHGDAALIYYPEGILHPPEDGIFDFDQLTLDKLGRIFADALWWPVATHVTWWGEDKPTALLAGPTLLPHPTGAVHDLLRDQLQTLRATAAPPIEVLLEGGSSKQESWNFSLTKRFFARYL